MNRVQGKTCIVTGAELVIDGGYSARGPVSQERGVPHS